MERRAKISECGQYRYWLSRRWGELRAGRPPIVFVMLNPSTADHEIDDPTIRRCISFAKREMAHGLMVMNLFALRATDPMALRTHPDPVGPENDDEIRRLLGDGYATVVCAWGAHSVAATRAEAFVRLTAGRSMYCLGMTKHGDPRHPLYVRRDQPLVPFPATLKGETDAHR